MKNQFLSKEHYTPIKIKSIKKIDREKTYDFTVKDHHSFLIDNNIISSNSVEYTPSISLCITKSKLKASNLDEFAYLYENGIPKDLDVLGIITKIELYKSRFTRPFRKIKLMIPYDHGLHEYAGLFDYLLTNEVIYAERKGYYNYKYNQFDKPFTRKKFISDGFAEKIVNDLIARENSGEVFDFKMDNSVLDGTEEVDENGEFIK